MSKAATGKASKSDSKKKTNKRQAWEEARAAILSSVDVQAEYESWGLVTVGDESDGWVKAHAFGRDDNNPSAAIYVGDGPSRGLYKDHANPGPDGTLTFFYAAARLGPHQTPQAAIRHYAKQLSIDLPEDLEDQIDWLPWVDMFAALFARAKGGGIDAAALVRAGAMRAKWPKTSPNPQSVFALPVFGPNLTDSEPCGWVLVSQNAQPVRVFQGKGKEPRLEKTHTLKGSKSGWMNRSACAAIKSGSGVELVWKVEGVSDCLALDSLIPDEFRGRHVVITNSAGCAENPRPDFLSHLAGKMVCVIGDADEPGQVGAAKWAAAIAASGVAVKNVKLPYPVEPSHGKDLRDWFSEGRSYTDLLALADATQEITPDSSASTATMAEEELCRAIGVDVLGELDSGMIRGYSQYHSKVISIPNIDRIGYASLQQLIGPAIKEKVKPTDDEDDERPYTIFDVRNAIAYLAGFRRLSDESMYGTGCWPIGGDQEEVIAIVNGGEAATWNGDKRLIPSTSPVCRGKILDLSNTESWVDLKQLETHMHAAEDPKWCMDLASDIQEIIGRWKWRHESDPFIASGLVMSTYVQAFFAWRPQVAVLGESGTGKTTFFQFLERTFGRLAITATKPTEAGVRQAVRNTSRAIVIDEFEEDRHRQQVLELIRTSSRGESSAILRGSQDQRGRRFSLRQICWVAAIEIGLKRDPDRNRFIHLELVKPQDAMRGRLAIPSETECRGLGVRLLAAALRYVWEVRRWAIDMKTLRVTGVSDRVIESYAVPVAMMARIGGMSLPDARMTLTDVLSARDLGEATISDQEELVDAILSGWVQLDHGKRATVAEILTGEYAEPGAVRQLEAHGISRCSQSRGSARRDLIPWTLLDSVFVDHRTVAEKILRGSRWQNQSLDQMLNRLPGAKRDRRKLSGRNARGVLLPIESFGVSKSAEEDF